MCHPLSLFESSPLNMLTHCSPLWTLRPSLLSPSQLFSFHSMCGKREDGQFACSISVTANYDDMHFTLRRTTSHHRWHFRFAKVEGKKGNLFPARLFLVRNGGFGVCVSAIPKGGLSCNSVSCLGEKLNTRLAWVVFSTFEVEKVQIGDIARTLAAPRSIFS